MTEAKLEYEARQVRSLEDQNAAFVAAMMAAYPKFRPVPDEEPHVEPAEPEVEMPREPEVSEPVPVKADADEERLPTMKEIAAEVCKKHGVSLRELRGPRRHTELVLARQELMWRIKTELPYCSLPMIGRFLDRDHTTILHGVRRHEERRAQAALTAGSR